jgi:hypothetical protein
MPTSHPSTTADTIAQMSRLMDDRQPPAFLEHVGLDDAYTRGDPPNQTLVIVPGIWSSMPPALLTAMRARRAFPFTGRCALCDAVADLAASAVHHEHDCPVGDTLLTRALRRWSMRVGQYARGRRLQECPVSSRPREQVS